MQGPIKRLLTFLIWIYKKVISPFIPKTCKFHPNCSQYAIDAIEGYGPIKGLYLALYRIIRCNPISKGGYDPVK